ncbi:MBL fold metallo-hydrolase [Halocynthiibacter sp. SDUM655004]|uniref:MBL fold metallo-hydrolase n=2 Tax=Paracoccaceae TaxID=31989 RepID=A0AAE3IXQ1_9RHOB|nr:MBL fold metallo-hydrolase [Halocynthiibacter sp. C4]MCV6823025.1 MBL fold metallo-hydrolase [Halocynthiibacter halioticoli]MCW4056026.1 MBL fold metallo-hydrolase [Halocynthiibacter sp. SDUM655004]MDE0591404.1 MBL fold metallo-hydrolase [Halocynthiibacter sp. C4]
MGDRVVLLGTKGGPAIRPNGPMPTSSLLEMDGKRIVVDCGLGVARGLVNAGMSLKELETIFITHLHSDHLLELGPLIHTAWTTGLAQEVTVFGPEGTRAYFAGFLQSMSFDNALRVADEGRRPLEELVQIVEYGEGEIAGSPVSTTALRVDHPPVTDCFALRFEANGKRVTFSADTAYFEPLSKFAEGSDLLIHEAMLAEGVDALVARTGSADRLRAHLMASHTVAEDVGKIATAAKCKHLALHHLVPADDPDFSFKDWEKAVRTSWDGALTIGFDGVEIRY